MNNVTPMTRDDYVNTLKAQYLVGDEELLKSIIAAHRETLTASLVLRVHGKFLRERNLAAVKQPGNKTG